MNKRTQTARIIDWLASGRGLTPITALKLFGTFRLGARIYDLRRMGHRIESKMVKRGDAMVAEYRLQ